MELRTLIWHPIDDPTHHSAHTQSSSSVAHVSSPTMFGLSRATIHRRLAHFHDTNTGAIEDACRAMARDARRLEGCDCVHAVVHHLVRLLTHAARVPVIPLPVDSEYIREVHNWALMWAAAEGETALVTCLAARMGFGTTLDLYQRALFTAAARGHLPVMDALCRATPGLICTDTLRRVASENNLAVAQYLNARPQWQLLHVDACSALCAAAARGHFGMVRYLWELDDASRFNWLRDLIPVKTAAIKAAALGARRLDASSSMRPWTNTIAYVYNMDEYVCLDSPASQIVAEFVNTLLDSSWTWRLVPPAPMLMFLVESLVGGDQWVRALTRVGARHHDHAALLQRLRAHVARHERHLPLVKWLQRHLSWQRRRTLWQLRLLRDAGRLRVCLQM